MGTHEHSRRGTTPDRGTRAGRLVSVALVLALVLGVAGAAFAYWSGRSTSGANGVGAAASVNQGATPTATSAGDVVTVHWAASTLSSGAAVTGYVVRRYDVATLTSQTVLSACTGTVAATTCTETSVPAGQWAYAVTPVLATYWNGTESPKSNPVATDPTPPVNAISITVGTGNALESGDTIYYRGTVAGSFTLTNAVADAGSGPASSATATLTGTPTGWTHSPTTVSAPAGGPYVSAAFSWAPSTSSSPTEVVTGRDVAGWTAATTLSFVNDSTPPGPGSVTYTSGYQPGRSVAVTFTTGTDDGSGLATRQLQRQSAPLAGGTCGSYGAFTDVGPDTPTSPYTDSQVTNGTCYTYRYVVTDQVGNQDIATSANVAKVDDAGALDHLVLAPATATITAGGSQGYTAEGFDASGNDLGDLSSATTITVDGSPCPAAVCSPATAGDHTVTGTDGPATGTATLHVNVRTYAAYAWGGNSYGQLGDGTTTNRAAPVQAGADTHWASAAAGVFHTVAVKIDGTLWAWGFNYYGQLGDGTTTNRAAPVQAGTDTHWASVAAGMLHTVAVKTDGTLWAWGFNTSGQLGDGTTTDRHAPVQVGTDTHWASAAAGQLHTVAVKTDGTLWAWGLNGSGQLGDGTTTSRAAPVQVGTDTHWATVGAGWGHTVAVKTDGTLWAWGSNNDGQLGDGTTTNRAAPVQVGTDTHWASAAAGVTHTAAVKTDGTLWAWGFNNNGQLGDGTTTNRAAPGQVGTDTQWGSVSAGMYHTIGLHW